jgi:hypothetical protein
MAAWASAAEPRGGVLVIHENRGLTEHIRTVAGRLAASGYSALALDLLSEEGGTGAFPGEAEVAAAPFYGPFPEGGALDGTRAAVLGVYGGLDARGAGPTAPGAGPSLPGDDPPAPENEAPRSARRHLRSMTILLCDPRVAAVPVRDAGEPSVRLDADFGPARAWVRRGLAERLAAARGVLPADLRLRVVNYPTEWWHWSYGDRYLALLTGVPAALYGPVLAEPLA